jgi:hypothetical protein
MTAPDPVMEQIAAAQELAVAGDRAGRVRRSVGRRW